MPCCIRIYSHMFRRNVLRVVSLACKSFRPNEFVNTGAIILCFILVKKVLQLLNVILMSNKKIILKNNICDCRYGRKKNSHKNFILDPQLAILE